MAECDHHGQWLSVGGGAYYCPTCKLVCECDAIDSGPCQMHAEAKEPQDGR